MMTRVVSTRFHGVKAVPCGPQGFSIRFPSNWLRYRLTREVLENPPDLRIKDNDLEAPLEFLAGLEGLIRVHLVESVFGVDALAELCGFHRETLNNRLTPYGRSASQVIARLRQEAAESLLIVGNTSVGETAQNLDTPTPRHSHGRFGNGLESPGGLQAIDWGGLAPYGFPLLESGHSPDGGFVGNSDVR